VWVDERPFFSIWRVAGDRRGLWIAPASRPAADSRGEDWRWQRWIAKDAWYSAGATARNERRCARRREPVAVDALHRVGRGSAAAVSASRPVPAAGHHRDGESWWRGRTLSRGPSAGDGGPLGAERVVSACPMNPVAAHLDPAALGNAAVRRVPSETGAIIFTHPGGARPPAAAGGGGLLNFGRIGSGRAAVSFEDVDAADVARHVAAEFENEIAAGRTSSSAGNGGCACALTRKPWGCAAQPVDNALKYSPIIRPCGLEWGRRRRAWRSACVIAGPASRRPSERRFPQIVRGLGGDGKCEGVGRGAGDGRHIVDAHRGRFGGE